MALKLIIDGNDFTQYSNLETISTIIGLNTSTESFNLETAGTTLTLVEDAAKYLKEIYIDNCHYPPKVLPVKLITDFGDFNLSILPHNFTWCDDCTGELLLSGGNNEEICFNRLNNTQVLNDSFWNYIINQNKFHKIVVSKDISSFNAVAVRIIGFIHIISNIFLPGPVKARSNFALYGTGRWVPAIKVNDILEYYANQCGKVFKSTILQNDPYNRMYIIPSVAEPGKWFFNFNLSLDETDIFDIDHTVVEFLNILNDVFNAEWRISENFIELTPVERIKQDAVNVGKLDPLHSICLTPINHNCAKQLYKYALDFVDSAGDSERDLYNHTEDYQIINRALSEPCELPIPFSVAVNPKGRSENEFVTSERSPANVQLVDIGDFMHTELLLSNHRSALPKLVINSLPAESNINSRFGKVIIMDQIDFKGHKLPNPQISFNREVPGNLYDKFHYKRNPANGYLHCKDNESIDVCLTQELFDNMRAAFRAGKTAYVTSDYGNMYFTSAEIFFGVGQRVQLNNIKVYNDE